MDDNRDHWVLLSHSITGHDILDPLLAPCLRPLEGPGYGIPEVLRPVLAGPFTCRLPTVLPGEVINLDIHEIPLVKFMPLVLLLKLRGLPYLLN